MERTKEQALLFELGLSYYCYLWHYEHTINPEHDSLVQLDRHRLDCVLALYRHYAVLEWSQDKIDEELYKSFLKAGASYSKRELMEYIPSLFDSPWMEDMLYRLK